MKILIEFGDKWAVILIGLLTIVGWIFSYSLVYTTYYLSTGDDPLTQFAGWIPSWLLNGLSWMGQNGGYISVISGMIFSSIISIIIIRSQKKRRR